MNLKVQNVATTPVLHAIENGGKCGRGERIRTSGPCLPKAVILAAHGSFPLDMAENTPHIGRSVPVRFTAEVQGATLEHCLKNGPEKRRQSLPALTKIALEVQHGF